jgi:hypothetical protein
MSPRRAATQATAAQTAPGASMIKPLWMLPLLATGCMGMVNNQVKSIAPRMMANEDLEVMCLSGAVFSPTLASLTEDPAAAPHAALVLTELSAGMCSDLAIWDTQIAYLRARYAGLGTVAQDLLEQERRQHEVAARRYQRAWNHLEAQYGEVGGACPKLNLYKNDDLIYLLGLTSGVLAVMNDRAAGGVVDVPLDVPMKVSRGAACLDNEAWWGMPEALQIAVGSSVPGGLPEGTDVPALLQRAATYGENLQATDKSGSRPAPVRMARALQVQTLSALGQEEALKKAIAEHAASLAAQPPDPNWALLDRFAERMILHESDKRWLEATGHRTPGDQRGRFPGDAPEVDADSERLLDALMAAPPEASPPAASPEASSPPAPVSPK